MIKQFHILQNKNLNEIFDYNIFTFENGFAFLISYKINMYRFMLTSKNVLTMHITNSLLCRPHKPTPLCLRPPTQQGDQITAYDDYYREKNVIPRKLLRPDPPDHRPTEVSLMKMDVQSFI